MLHGGVRRVVTSALGVLLALSVAGCIRPPVPEIKSISPSSAAPGATLTITGGAFDAGGNKGVTIGGVDAKIISVTSDKIVVEVPADAESGKVTVYNANGHADSSFTLSTGGSSPPADGGGEQQATGSAEAFTAAAGDLPGLKPKGQPHTGGKVTFLFDEDFGEGRVAEAAEAAGFTDATGVDLSGAGVTFASAWRVGFTDAAGAAKVAKEWQKASEDQFTIKLKDFGGTWSDGTRYSGFTVSLLGGDDSVFIVAPSGPAVYQLSVTGTPRAANEENATQWLETLVLPPPV